MRRSIVALAAGILLLALAVPALAQDPTDPQDPYPPVPAPTCALVIEVVTLPGIISLQGSNWEPNSTVEIVILGLVYEVQTDEDGNFREDILISEEDLLLNLPDDINLEELLELTIECRGTDQAGEPRSVFLTIQVRITLVDGVDPDPDAPTCFGVITLVDTQPLLSWQGAGWEPGSTVLVTPALVAWEAVVGDDGTFAEEVVVAGDELINLFDDIQAGLLECEGTDADGQDRVVPLTLEIDPTLLEDLGLPPLLPEGGGTDSNGLISSLLGTGGDAVIQLPPSPLSTRLLSAEAQPVDWDPRTNGATFVALLAMLLIMIGGADFLVWSRKHNDVTLPDGQNG
ncbi:MAG TPA: hypothetical protein VM324_01695 [Egibacteraceae bacterium]|nr:hypothetical protein [Egibacteraceae bacterium]